MVRGDRYKSRLAVAQRGKRLGDNRRLGAASANPTFKLPVGKHDRPIPGTA